MGPVEMLICLDYVYVSNKPSDLLRRPASGAFKGSNSDTQGVLPYFLFNGPFFLYRTGRVRGTCYEWASVKTWKQTFDLGAYINPHPLLPLAISKPLHGREIYHLVFRLSHACPWPVYDGSIYP